MGLAYRAILYFFKLRSNIPYDFIAQQIVLFLLDGEVRK